MIKKKLIYIICILAPIILCATIFLSNVTKYKADMTSALTAMIGAISYSFIMIQIFMGARPNFILKYFWDDQYYDIHRKLGIVAVLLGVIHGFLEYYLGRRTSLISIIGYVILAMFIIISILAIAFMSEKWLKKNRSAKYNFHVIFHRIMGLLGITLLIHVLLSRVANQVKGVYIGYFVITALFYIYYLFKKIKATWNIVDNKE